MPTYIDWDVYGTSAINRYQTSIGVREMSLSSNEFQETRPSPVSGIPLLNTGTMRMRVGSGGTLLIVPKYPGATATERGIISGKIRTVLRWDWIGGVTYTGLSAMHSVVNLVSSSGFAY